jgi:hypothetical protein
MVGCVALEMPVNSKLRASSSSGVVLVDTSVPGN